jgi:hypothetical protein
MSTEAGGASRERPLLLKKHRLRPKVSKINSLLFVNLYGLTRLNIIIGLRAVFLGRKLRSNPKIKSHNIKNQ